MQIEVLRETVADLFDLNRSELGNQTAFQASGQYDSLKVVLLMAALEEDFGLNVPPGQAADMNCIQDILDFAQTQGVCIES